jgi:hypothetical protein
MFFLKANLMLTNAIKQSPTWEPNSHVAAQVIPSLLWNQKVHYRNHKCQPLDRVLYQKKISPHLHPISFKIHFNIVLPSMSKPPNPNNNLCIKPTMTRREICICNLYLYFVYSYSYRYTRRARFESFATTIIPPAIVQFWWCLYLVISLLQEEAATTSKNCSKVRMLMDWRWREESGGKPESVVGPGLLLALPGDQNDVISKL